MRLIRTSLALLMALLGWVAFAPAQAAPAGAAIVLDGSAAMLTKLGNQTKLDVARVAIGYVLRTPVAGQPVGLVAYGHRNKTSCTDVEVVVPPAVGSAANILAATKKLAPTGKASIVAAAKAAAQALEYDSKPANIIVIAAAPEGCMQDPCMTGMDLETDGNDLTITVIGLGLTADQGKSLACLATSTGGTYSAAANADELIAVLDKALKPELPLPPATVRGPAKVEQGTTFSVEWTGPKEKGDRVEIAWPGSKAGQHLRSFLVQPNGKPGTLMAPIGRGQYELRYYLVSRDKVIARQAIEVVPGTPHIEAPDSVAQGTNFTAVWKGPVTEEDVIEVTPTGGGKALSSGHMQLDTGEAVLNAPPAPGSYEIAFRSATDPKNRVAKPLTVTAIDVKIEAPAQISGGTEFRVTWAGPGANLDEIELARPDMPDSRRIFGAKLPAAGKPVLIDAPADGGSFVLRYRSGKSGTVLKKVPITIAKATGTVDAPAEVDGGASFDVSWTGPGARNDEIAIAQVGAPPGSAVTSTPVSADGKPVSVDAPVGAGDYEVRYWSARSRVVLASKRIKVRKPNVTLQIAGAVSAGKPFSVQWTGPAGRYDDLRIGPPDGTGDNPLRSSLLAGAGKPVTLLAPDKPGTYQLRYWSAKGKAVLAAIPLTVQ